MKNGDRHKVESYFTSFSFPPESSSDKDMMTVTVKYTNGQWEQIHQQLLDGKEGISYKRQKEAASVILNHFKGNDSLKDLSFKLISWPGHSLCRLTPADLVEFINKYGQMELL